MSQRRPGERINDTRYSPRSSPHRPETPQKPWFRREFGGGPVWLTIVLLALILTVLVIAALYEPL